MHTDFENYYSEYPPRSSPPRCGSNNAWVAALCIALGVLGLPVVYLLSRTSSTSAIVASIMMRHDRGGLFFGLILPHGLLELTAVFVAGGVGLRLFWPWVEPGARRRGESLRRRAAPPSRSRSGWWRCSSSAASSRLS